MNEQIREEEMEIDLLEIAHVLMRKIVLIILCTAIGGVLVAGYTKFLVIPQYTASSMIYILTKTTSITSLADLQMGSQLTVDFKTLATSRPVVEDVIEKLDLQYDYDEMLEMITIENPANTRILQLSVTNPSGTLARDMSNALADSVSNRVAEVMTTDKPTTVEKAVKPQYPSSPNVAKNTIIGALLGLLLSVGIIIVLHLLDDTIKDEEDVKKYLGLNTLAAIPLDKTIGNKVNTKVVNKIATTPVKRKTSKKTSMGTIRRKR